MNLLIKGVQIVDGYGGAPYKADVLIQKNIISAIGDLKHKKADETIDGLGNYLTPGFIDIDTDSDHYLHLFTNPSQSDFTNQGVTTIIGGHCGMSLAPLLYGNLESLGSFADVNKANVNWYTIAELLNSLKRVPLGVNFGTLVGHKTVRDALTRGEHRELTEKEFKIFENIIWRAMEDGAFGFSTGLGYIHGQYASEKEVKGLVSTLKGRGGIYATHLRSQTSELLRSVEETVRVANYTEVKTVISHLRPLVGYEEQFRKALEYIKENTPKESLFFDIYPHDTSIYPIYMLLPRWAQLDSATAMLEELRNPDAVSRIKKDLAGTAGKLSNVQIASAPRNSYLVGRTVLEAAKDLEASPIDTLITIMNMTNLKATVFLRDINFDVLTKALVDERALIASNGNSPAPGEFLKHERSTNTFPKFLELVLSKKLMTLEAAIKKITYDPARCFGIKGRGVIEEGRVADMALLDKDDWKVREVILGGRLSLGGKGGSSNNASLPPKEPIRGAILRHTA